MPVKVSKRKGKFRVVEVDTGRVARHKSGKASDGGGHDDKEKAKRQARAINSALARKRSS